MFQWQNMFQKVQRMFAKKNVLNGIKCFFVVFVYRHLWPCATLHYLEWPIVVINGLVMMVKYRFESVFISRSWSTWSCCLCFLLSLSENVWKVVRGNKKRSILNKMRLRTWIIPYQQKQFSIRTKKIHEQELVQVERTWRPRCSMWPFVTFWGHFWYFKALCLVFMAFLLYQICITFFSRS